MSSEQMPRSILMVLDERARQVVEKGYTAEHDQHHESEELAAAGATYALPDHLRTRPWVPGSEPGANPLPTTWPWTEEFWKPVPDDRVRELVKGAALIIAEIDRLLLEEVEDA